MPDTQDTNRTHYFSHSVNLMATFYVTSICKTENNSCSQSEEPVASAASALTIVPANCYSDHSQHSMAYYFVFILCKVLF